jgi:hypothetical protein
MLKCKKYWIRFNHLICHVCGQDHSYKERAYNKKPKNYYKRHIMICTYYCGCLNKESL